jgi:site-specific DNA recombinase
VIAKSLNDHLVAEKEKPNSSITQGGDRRTVLKQVARIDVHQDRLTILWKPADAEEASDPADGRTLLVPWQKPPSRKSRQILIPSGVPQNEVRPTRIERRARLVSAIARGCRWLDEIVSGPDTDINQIAAPVACVRSI